MKTLSSFVEYARPLITLDGDNDYKNVERLSIEYFGARLPNAAVWKVIVELNKATAQFLDDLE